MVSEEIKSALDKAIERADQPVAPEKISVKSKLLPRSGISDVDNKRLWQEQNRARLALGASKAFICVTLDRDGCLKCHADTVATSNTPGGRFFRHFAGSAMYFFTIAEKDPEGFLQELETAEEDEPATLENHEVA